MKDMHIQTYLIPGVFVLFFLHFLHLRNEQGTKKTHNDTTAEQSFLLVFLLYIHETASPSSTLSHHRVFFFLLVSVFFFFFSVTCCVVEAYAFTCRHFLGLGVFFFLQSLYMLISLGLVQTFFGCFFGFWCAKNAQIHSLGFLLFCFLCFFVFVFVGYSFCLSLFSFFLQGMLFERFFFMLLCFWSTAGRHIDTRRFVSDKKVQKLARLGGLK